MESAYFGIAIEVLHSPETYFGVAIEVLHSPETYFGIETQRYYTHPKYILELTWRDITLT